MNQREKWVDSVKGFAIFCVVLGHCNNLVFDGQHNFFTYLTYFIYCFHMPLFFAISGYLYGKQNNKMQGGIKETVKYVLWRVINLGIPFSIFVLLHTIVYSFQDGFHLNNNSFIIYMMKMVIASMSDFWFLAVLMLISAVVPVLDYYLKNKKLILIAFFAAAVVIGFVFNAGGVLFVYFLCFYMGAYICSNISVLQKRLLFLVSLVVFAAFSIAYYFPTDGALIVKVYPKLILGVLGSFVFIYLFYHCKPLANFSVFVYLGKYTLAIYVLHVWIYKYTNSLLVSIQLNSYLCLFIDTLVGICIPILIVKIAEKIPVIDFVFYPGKYLKAKFDKCFNKG